MNETNLIEKVKKDIENKDISQHKDLNDYLVARDLLLHNGFINNSNKQLQEAYIELFPTNFKLKKELEGSLKDILSNDVETRISTSKDLEKASRRETSMLDKLWLKEPRTIDILCLALNDENVKVLENIILCLGNIASRYKYNDLAIFDKIISKFDKANDRLKIRIAQSCGEFDTNKKWEYIYKALECKPKKDAIERLTRHLRNQHQEISIEYRDKFIKKLLTDFYDEKNKNELIKATALNTAILLMQKEDLEKLRNIRDNYSLLSSSKKAVAKRIEELENH
ncbi:MULTISPECIES: hypothetical protein [unclassified Lacinutrix]